MCVCVWADGRSDENSGLTFSDGSCAIRTTKIGCALRPNRPQVGGPSQRAIEKTDLFLSLHVFASRRDFAA